MWWTVRGANASLALRCSQLNGRFESYWEERAAYVMHPLDNFRLGNAAVWPYGCQRGRIQNRPMGSPKARFGEPRFLCYCPAPAARSSFATAISF